MQISTRVKQILLIILFLLVTAGMLLLVYFVFFKPTPPLPPSNANVNGQTGVLPNTNANAGPTVIGEPVGNINAVTGLPEIDTIARGGNTLVTPLTEGATVQNPTFINGEFRYYDPVTGEFYILTADGKKSLLADQKFKGVTHVEFSKAGKQAVLTFEDGRNLFYDFATGDQATLPNEMKDIEISEDGKSIGFEFVGTGDNKWLGVSSPNGSGIEVIDDLSEPEMIRKTEIDWSPTGEVVANVHHPDTGTTQKVYFFARADQKLQVMPIDGYGFSSSWAPQGDKLLYNIYNPTTGYRPSLEIANMAGGNVSSQHALGVYTWEEKCAFSGSDVNTLYCGVPNSLEESTGIFPQLNTSPDTIYKIDLRSGVSSPIAVPTDKDGVNDFRVESMYVAPDGRQLYFKDEISGQMYSLNL